MAFLLLLFDCQCRYLNDVDHSHLWSGAVEVYMGHEVSSLTSAASLSERRTKHSPEYVFFILGFTSSREGCVLRPGGERHPGVVQHFTAESIAATTLGLGVALG